MDTLVQGLLSVIQVVSFIGELFQVPCKYRLYGPCECISRLREYIQSLLLVDRELTYLHFYNVRGARMDSI